MPENEVLEACERQNKNIVERITDYRSKRRGKALLDTNISDPDHRSRSFGVAKIEDET